MAQVSFSLLEKPQPRSGIRYSEVPRGEPQQTHLDFLSVFRSLPITQRSAVTAVWAHDPQSNATCSVGPPLSAPLDGPTGQGTQTPRSWVSRVGPRGNGPSEQVEGEAGGWAGARSANPACRSSQPAAGTRCQARYFPNVTGTWCAKDATSNLGNLLTEEIGPKRGGGTGTGVKRLLNFVLSGEGTPPGRAEDCRGRREPTVRGAPRQPPQWAAGCVPG